MTMEDLAGDWGWIYQDSYHIHNKSIQVMNDPFSESSIRGERVIIYAALTTRELAKMH